MRQWKNFVESTAPKEDRDLYHAYLENPKIRRDFKGSQLSIVSLAETVLAMRRELAEKEDKRIHGASFVQRTHLAEKSLRNVPERNCKAAGLRICLAKSASVS